MSITPRENKPASQPVTRLPVQNGLTASTATAVMLVVCGLVLTAILGDIAVSVIRETRNSQQIESNPWRRTARGWEDMRRWNPLPQATQPHPLMLAAWMLMAGIGSLYCCASESSMQFGSNTSAEVPSAEEC